MRNPFLDGLDPLLKARAGGSRGLTIKRKTGAQAPTKPLAPPPVLPPLIGGGTPPAGGGSGGGSGGDYGFNDGNYDQVQMLDDVSGSSNRKLLLKAKY